MKSAIIITVIAFSTLMTKAQESGSRLKLYAINAGVGSFHFEKNINGHDGVSVITDVTVSLNKNLISASYSAGTSIRILAGPNYGFEEFGLLYGREWKALDWLRFEGFAGIGHFSQNNNNDSIGDESTISFPLRVNTKFYFTKTFGMGLNTNYSINSINNNLSTNVIFHYKFN